MPWARVRRKRAASLELANFCQRKMAPFRGGGESSGRLSKFARFSAPAVRRHEMRVSIL